MDEERERKVCCAASNRCRALLKLRKKGGRVVVVVWLSRSVAQFFSLKNIERNLFFFCLILFFWWPLGCQGEPRPFLPHSSLFHTGHTGKKESSFSFFFFLVPKPFIIIISTNFLWWGRSSFFLFGLLCFVCVCVTCWWDFFFLSFFFFPFGVVYCVVRRDRIPPSASFSVLKNNNKIKIYKRKKKLVVNIRLNFPPDLFLLFFSEISF